VNTERSEPERLVVIGAGTMGVGIAYTALTAGYRVDLVEADGGRRDAVRPALTRLWETAVTRGKLAAEQAEHSAGLLELPERLSEVEAGPHAVIEAVPERLELKRDVLVQAERLRPHLLATNTSSIAIAQLANALSVPERFCGLHFFNPVWAMALIEIVVGSATSESTAEAARSLALALGKQPILIRDTPGFATSRLGVCLGLEAIRMVEDGVASPSDIDTAMVLGYRHPVGPLHLGDLVGLDVRLDIARTLEAAYGDRFAPPKLLEAKVAAGQLGAKTGEGFYRWDNGTRIGEASLP
jgi:3-hydroxybutyryl-CoA dehydrogenase